MFNICGCLCRIIIDFTVAKTAQVVTIVYFNFDGQEMEYKLGPLMLKLISHVSEGKKWMKMF
jgi:hypothetical protein